jgi:hypothetical protein
MLKNYDIVSQGYPNGFWSGRTSLNDHYENMGVISIKDFSKVKCPQHVPSNVMSAFDEGAACLAIGANNAACAMFRASVDLATKELIPDEGDGAGPTKQQRRTLFGRIEWLVSQGTIGKDIADLATCIREDGNDGVHACTLTSEDAHDNLDFADALLTRLFTEPARVALAHERRNERRKGSDN